MADQVGGGTELAWLSQVLSKFSLPTCGCDEGMIESVDRMLSKCRLPGKLQGQLTVVDPSQGRRCLEGIIEPAHQVPVNKQLLPQQRHQIG
jgi:hypothetical protein